MSPDKKHIILLGFKHVGKSVVGKQLATTINKPFIDLDEETEYLFKKKFNQQLSSRQIMQNHGEEFFRNLEKEALAKVLLAKPAIIALGGGTPLDLANQTIIKPHLLVYIKAPHDIVFNRIMAHGHPAFFSPEKEPYNSFKKLWQEREKIYQKLADFSVDNGESVNQTVLQIIEKL